MQGNFSGGGIHSPLLVALRPWDGPLSFFITPIPAPPPVPTGVIMMIVEPQLEFRCDGPGRFGQWGAPAGLTMLAHYARATERTHEPVESGRAIICKRSGRQWPCLTAEFLEEKGELALGKRGMERRSEN
jgi:hypothetical protein